MLTDASFAYQEGIFADPVPLTRPFSAKPGLDPSIGAGVLGYPVGIRRWCSARLQLLWAGPGGWSRCRAVSRAGARMSGVAHRCSGHRTRETWTPPLANRTILRDGSKMAAVQSLTMMLWVPAPLRGSARSRQGRGATCRFRLTRHREFGGRVGSSTGKAGGSRGSRREESPVQALVMPVCNLATTSSRLKDAGFCRTGNSTRLWII